MKEILKDKLRRLNHHLEANAVDVTVVTFNWFLTLFIDALPTEVGDKSFLDVSLVQMCTLPLLLA